MDSSKSEGEDHDQLRRSTPKKIRIPTNWTSNYERPAKPSTAARLTLINADDPQFRPVNTLKASRLSMQSGSSMDVFDEARCMSLDRRSSMTKSMNESRSLHLASERPTPVRSPHGITSDSNRDPVFSEGFSKYRRQTFGSPKLGKARAAPTTKRTSRSIEIISDDEESARVGGEGSLSSPLAMAQSLMYPEGGAKEGKNTKPRRSDASLDLASLRKQLPVESLRLGDNLFISTSSLGQSITLTLDGQVVYLAIDTDEGETHMIEIDCNLVEEVYVRHSAGLIPTLHHPRF